MVESSHSEDNSRSASQEIACLLQKPKLYYHIHKSLPLLPILSQMNPVHTLISYIYKNEFNIILPPVVGLRLSGFLTKIL
jgi:hypothetical protein